MQSGDIFKTYSEYKIQRYYSWNTCFKGKIARENVKKLNNIETLGVSADMSLFNSSSYYSDYIPLRAFSSHILLCKFSENTNETPPQYFSFLWLVNFPLLDEVKMRKNFFVCIYRVKNCPVMSPNEITDFFLEFVSNYREAGKSLTFILITTYINESTIGDFTKISHARYNYGPSIGKTCVRKISWLAKFEKCKVLKR